MVVSDSAGTGSSEPIRTSIQEMSLRKDGAKATDTVTPSDDSLRICNLLSYSRLCAGLRTGCPEIVLHITSSVEVSQKNVDVFIGVRCLLFSATFAPHHC